MLSFTTGLVAILTQLRRAVVAFADRQARPPATVWLGTTAFAPLVAPSRLPPVPTETWVLFWHRLNRIAARFQALIIRWRDGTLPAPRPSRAGKQARAPRPPTPRLPAMRGWVNARDDAAAPCAAALADLLENPDLPAFLAEVPRAGRLLRPLCHALAVPLPPALKLPSRVSRRPPVRPPTPIAASPAQAAGLPFAVPPPPFSRKTA